MEANKSMPAYQIWWLAARPKTLPAAAAPVIAATALAFHDGFLQPLVALACLLTALLLQIAANLANDLFDFQRGTDTNERLGPLRVTQAGLLSASQIKTGMAVCFLLAAFLGIYVSILSSWHILLIGIAAIIAALAYSGGPIPYGYYGLGELGVFLFFGLAAVCGTYFGQTKTITTASILISISMGCLSTAILVVNNLRDIATDRLAGKKTLSVIFGESFTRYEYFNLLVVAFIIPIILCVKGLTTPYVLVSFLSIPMALRTGRKVYQSHGRALNQVLAETGQLELIFALFIGLGFILDKVI
ncbi:1,4-dihydroxy-2-naphthoate prenyltransferase [Leptolinea tardivitalis]|uniref:1,4-dihydroxy-2-naphthoate octaprenyltransferase n=2 Tax=Leptolinea tardivitalis TaxID=229920 RepID=A0A0P6XBA1_9CHLR|nr:1,4-dihydroxy-2-naphthoate prenyltransferase [Leptolinea tardivitalis]GAP21190.1 1,4-dihydroxy-2-naphthoate prenyltransferase [Leptolinea tardivitalis]